MTTVEARPAAGALTATADAKPSEDTAAASTTTVPAGCPCAAVLDAARPLAARMALTPKWRDRLSADAVALVEAVLEHDRAGATS